MRFGLQSVQEDAKACAIRAYASSAAFLALACSELSSAGFIEVLLEPKPWLPRQDRKRRARLIDEHRKRIGIACKARYLARIMHPEDDDLSRDLPSLRLSQSEG
jgi:hypothetical protein